MFLPKARAPSPDTWHRHVQRSRRARKRFSSSGFDGILAQGLTALREACHAFCTAPVCPESGGVLPGTVAGPSIPFFVHVVSARGEAPKVLA
jgi:hypothetical protein